MPVLAFLIIGCAENPEEMWTDIDKRLLPDYRLYFTGNPEEQVRAMPAILLKLDNADSRIWSVRDRESIEAIEYGRLSLAEARAGNAELARKYRTQAVHAHTRRKVWNSEYQQALPVTPVPSEAEADAQLFAMIAALDTAISKSPAINVANRVAGSD